MDNPFQTIIERLGSIEALLQKLQSEQGTIISQTPSIHKILTISEFCEYTGLARQTAYKLTSAQKVPHSKRGKRLYFDREKVDTWLLENQVATQAEIQQRTKDYLSKNRVRRRM